MQLMMQLMMGLDNYALPPALHEPADFSRENKRRGRQPIFLDTINVASTPAHSANMPRSPHTHHTITIGEGQDATAEVHRARSSTRPSFLESDGPSKVPSTNVVSLSTGNKQSRDKQRGDKGVQIRHNPTHYGPDSTPGYRATTITIDPLSPQDLTVHISLPLRDDLEATLEDFSRLRRLGRFREALELFEDRLTHFLDNRYVLVQYGLCLYEAGQIARLSELAEKQHLQNPHPKDAVQLCWTMLLFMAEAHTSMHVGIDIIDITTTALSMLNRSWPHLDSLEMRN
jgi:hypothetical protein